MGALWNIISNNGKFQKKSRKKTEIMGLVGRILVWFLGFLVFLLTTDHSTAGVSLQVKMHFPSFNTTFHAKETLSAANG